MTTAIDDSGTVAATDESITMIAGQRATSLDYFRGMLLVISAIVWLASPALHEWPQNAVFNFLAGQFGPSIWHGVTLYDLLVPGFLFVAGISTAKSVARRKSDGQTKSAILSHLIKRCLMLLFMGIVLGNLSLPAWSDIRWLGVLQRIGICQLAVGTLCLVADRTIQLVVASIVLVNYGIAFDAFAMAPPATASQRQVAQTIDPYSVEYNIAAQIDKTWLPGRKYQGNWDAQGILTTLPAFVITLCGAILNGALFWRTGPGKEASSNRSVLVVSVVMVPASLILDHFVQPMNSYLLTPAFVLIAVGVCGIVMVVFSRLATAATTRSNSDSLIGSGRHGTIAGFGRNSLLMAVLLSVSSHIIPNVFPYIERTFAIAVSYPWTLIAIWAGTLLWFCGRFLVCAMCSVHVYDRSINK